MFRQKGGGGLTRGGGGGGGGQGDARGDNKRNLFLFCIIDTIVNSKNVCVT